ncbi:MAG: type II secretion system protein GspG [Planctomycetota bacterium]
MKLLSRLLVCAGVLASVASSRGCRLVNEIPAKNMTSTRLTGARTRIEKFWNKHHRVPLHPDDLPDEPNRDCSMRDGWGRKLNWHSDGKRTVKVWSLGRDGEPGGTGEDADMEIEFVVKQEGQEDLPPIDTRDVPP